MKRVASSDQELTVEERNLLSVAYKNVIGARRASWRIVSSIEQKEESKGNESQVAMIKSYRSKIEEELSGICDDILEVLDKHLIASAASGESKVFYHKMQVINNNPMTREMLIPISFPLAGRVTTTVTSPSSPPTPSAKSRQTSPSRLTRRHRTSPPPNSHRRTPSASVSPSTSPSSTTRFSTAPTAPATSPSKPSTTPLPNSTPSPKRATRIRPSSCNSSEITSPSGQVTCRKLVSQLFTLYPAPYSRDSRFFPFRSSEKAGETKEEPAEHAEEAPAA